MRVVNSGFSSSRPGATGNEWPVQTYRTDAITGALSPVANEVGGASPGAQDSPANLSGANLSTLTAQSVTPARIITGIAISDVDFGYSFNVVVNKNNAGQGSVRQFLTNANALGNAGLAQAGRAAAIDNAVFMLADGTARPGLQASYPSMFVGGIATIAPTSALPTVTGPVVVDAQTQPGWSSAPIVELTGAGAGAGVSGLSISAGASTVRGLIVNNFLGSGISLSGAGGNTIQGNYLGTNAAGSASSQNGQQGVFVNGSPNNLIGGTTAAQRNVMSGNGLRGILVDGAGATGNTVSGNFIGTNAAGTGAVANAIGVYVNGAGSNTFGGTAAGAANVISGNTQIGLYFVAAGSTGNFAQGNVIGLNAAASAPLANGTQGIEFTTNASNNTIGGAAAGAPNIIASNGGVGVRVISGTGNLLQRNSIYGNGSIGIDLGMDGVTVNDGAKTAGQPNLLMDSPVFTSVALSGTTLTVAGYVGNAPNLALFAGARVEIFRSDNDSSGSGEGQAYLGFLTADGNGNFSGSLTVSGLSVGDRITGTATDGSSNTSEFSSNRLVVSPGITVAPTSGLVTTEAGGTATFTVVLNTQPTANVTVGLSSSNTAEGTVAPVSLTFTAANWNVAQTVTVTGVDDFVVDGNIAYTIITAAATSTDTTYNGINPSDVSVTNTDNDVAGITVTPTSGLVTTEAGGTATFTVVLTSQPTANVTVALSSSDATEGTVGPASLTFTAVNWNTPQTVTVTGVDDDLDDGDIVYSIITAAATSSDAVYNGINPADVSVTNTDNDTAGITVTPTSGLVTTEAGGTATFTIVLTSQPTANVTIALSSSDATEGTVAPASVTFTTVAGNWNTPRTITVTGVDDDLDDGDIAYNIITAAAVSSDSNYSGLNPADVSVTNTDDDSAGITVTPTSGLLTTEAGGTATFTVVLTSQPTANVTIGLSSSDLTEGTVAPASLTFTPANWGSAQTVTVTGVDDFVVDGIVVYTIITAAAVSSDGSYSGLDAADVVVANNDDDTAGITVTPTSGLVTTESGGTATFTVVLTSQPTANVTVGMSSSDLTEGTVAPASLTFTAANWNSAQTVTVTGVDDVVVDGNVAYTIVTAAATSSDTTYNGINPADVSVTNADDDVTSFTIVPTSGLVTTEAGGTATFTVVLTSQPIADVTVALSSSDLTEGTVGPASLTFTSGNWNIAQTVTVTGVDDDLDDGDIGYSVVTATAVSADPGYSGIDPADVLLTNIDNDTAGITVTPTTGLVTTEAGGMATFTVVLNTQPTANVTVGLSSSNIAEGTVAPASLTFTAANWNVAQTVTVTGVDDLVVDGDVAYTIVTATATSSDATYNGINPTDVSVTNTDNDTAGITVTPTSGLVTTEAGGTATFTVVLTSQPTANVTVALSSSDATEGTVAPASVTFTTAAGNWNTPRTVTVTGVDDLVVDGDIVYSIVTAAAVSSDSNYSGLDPDDVSVTNTDNDTAGITVNPTSGLVTTEAGGTATFTVVLNSQPTADVTVALSSSDPTEGTVAPASLTFTAANWNSAQTVTVTGVDDAIADGDVPYSIITAAAVSTDGNYNGLNATDVSVTNTDDDIAGITVSPTTGLVTTEAGGTATFTVVLNSQPTADVTIALSSNDLTEGTVAPASLTFTAANWNITQTVTVTGVDDAIADGNIAYSIVTAAAVSTDGSYSGFDAADVSVTNTDNDTAGITVSPTAGLVTTEAGGTATLTVVLNSQPTADVTIALSSSDLTEGTVGPASLTFTAANWNVAQTVTVTGVDDALADGDIAYSIVTASATSTDGSYSGVNPADVSVTNTDNDTAGITVSPTTGLITTEAGGTATFTVVLNSQPTADVTIALQQQRPYRRYGWSGIPDIHGCQLERGPDSHRYRC